MSRGPNNAMGNGASTHNEPPDMSWAQELMIRDPTSWTLTGWETPA